MLEFWLELAKRHQLPIHIISREGKEVLHEFLETWKEENLWELTLQILPQLRGEWPSTVLASQAFWQGQNILGLPDTYFEKEIDFCWLVAKLEQNASPLNLLLHELTQGELPSRWGMVDVNNKHKISWFEKPNDHWPSLFAWGLFSFSQEMGVELFQKLEWSTQNQRPFGLAIDYSWRRLSLFRDLTR